jgi:hypothetical protein
MKLLDFRPDPRCHLSDTPPALPFGTTDNGRGYRMAFLFRLETTDGEPAEPPSLDVAIPNWRSGDEIPLGRRVLRVVRIRDDEADQPPVLVVEDMAG